MSHRGLGFVLILWKAASVLCYFVSLVIKRSCSHLPFVSITVFLGSDSQGGRGTAHSQEPCLGLALQRHKPEQSKAKGHRLQGPCLETDPETQILTKKEFEGFGQWDSYSSLPNPSQTGCQNKRK